MISVAVCLDMSLAWLVPLPQGLSQAALLVLHSWYQSNLKAQLREAPSSFMWQDSVPPRLLDEDSVSYWLL